MGGAAGIDKSFLFLFFKKENPFLSSLRSVSKSFERLALVEQWLAGRTGCAAEPVHSYVWMSQPMPYRGGNANR
jgi:hypothetical protein